MMDKSRNKSIADILLGRRNAVQAYGMIFQRTFGARLGNYMHPLFGFDVIKFDEQIARAKNGESTKDVIEREYGKEAVELILKLIRID